MPLRIWSLVVLEVVLGIATAVAFSHTPYGRRGVALTVAYVVLAALFFATLAPGHLRLP